METMKTYYVCVPVSCSMTLEIEAASEADAIAKTLECLDQDQMPDGSELPPEEHFQIETDSNLWSLETAA